MRTKEEIQMELDSLRRHIAQNQMKAKLLEEELLTAKQYDIPDYTGQYVKFRLEEGVMHVKSQSIVDGYVVMDGIRICYDHSKQTVNSDSKPSFQELDIILDALHTTVSYLLGNPYTIITKEEYLEFLNHALENIKKTVEE